MRLGLYGGTFDPIHLGHLILAEQCLEACGLDRVWLIVAGSPPHKPGGRTPVGHRLEMVGIAIAGHPAFAASDIEAKRPGPHYSVETLESIRRDHPDDELFFLIGADSLADLPTWREPERIARLATIVVVNRPGIEEADPARLPDFGPGSYPLAWVSIPPVGIASSDLRRRLAEGWSIRYMVPRGVEAYIEAHGLYRDAGKVHAPPPDHPSGEASPV
jgi:nicotinate-nucleotide adenylyltransferase